ncbi:hypothetical protein AAF712_015506, partial [Marasmius tenuissimus]
VVQIVMVRSAPPQTFSGKIVQQIFKAMIVQLVGIYPTLLVVVVYLQRSLWDASGHSTFKATPGMSEDDNGDGGRSQIDLDEKNNISG